MKFHRKMTFDWSGPFLLGFLHDLQTAAVYIGSTEIEMSLHERIDMIEAVEQSQMRQMAAMGSHLMGMLAVDESDSLYQSLRSTTTIGLEIGSFVTGGYGAVKGVIAFNRLAKASLQISRIPKSGRIVNNNILTREGIRSYLSNAKLLRKNQIIYDFESIGLKLKGKSPDGRFMDFMDKFGNVRVKIHPPDRVTNFDHLHIYDKLGNPLNKYLEIVESTSVDAHIPYGGN